jgi:hypothetical protein
MKILILFLICGCISYSAQTQFYFYNNRYYDRDFLFETGISAGLMNALTDLGGTAGGGKKGMKDINFCNNQVCAGFYGLVNFRSMASLQLQYTHGRIRAFDSILHNNNNPSTGRYERNLSFESAIDELALSFQLYPINIISKAEKPPLLSPFISMGAGLFHFNPRAYLNGASYELHELHTEGEGFAEYPDRKNYTLFQPTWLIGSGLRFELSPTVNLRMEFEYRVLLTDYLDDVSTSYIEPKLFKKYLPAGTVLAAYLLNDRRGELDPTHEPSAGDKRGGPNQNDSYFNLEIKLGIVLGREKIK